MFKSVLLHMSVFGTKKHETDLVSSLRFHFPIQVLAHIWNVIVQHTGNSSFGVVVSHAFQLCSLFALSVEAIILLVVFLQLVVLVCMRIGWNVAVFLAASCCIIVDCHRYVTEFCSTWAGDCGSALLLGNMKRHGPQQSGGNSGDAGGSTGVSPMVPAFEQTHTHMHTHTHTQMTETVPHGGQEN
eukprot:1616978-Amphidinium_carterae.2